MIRTAPSRLLVACALLVLACPRPAAQESSATAVERTEASVQARVAELGVVGDLDLQLRDRLLELWRGVLSEVRARDAQRAIVAEATAQVASAPERLAAVRRDLGALPDEPRLESGTDLDLPSLQARLAEAEAILEQARAGRAQLDDERAKRATRRTEIPKAIVAARDAMGAVSVGGAAGDGPQVVEALEALATERRAALAASIAALEAERTSYDARVELLAAREDLASRELALAEAAAEHLRRVISARMEQERAAAERRAEQQRLRTRDASPVVRDLVDGNAALLLASNDLAERRELDRAALSDLQAVLAAFVDRRDRVLARVDRVGFTSAIVTLLRRERDALPDLGGRRKALAEDQRRLLELEARFLELEDERAQLTDLDRYVAALLARRDAASPGEDPEVLRASLRALAAERRRHVDEAIQGAGAAFDLLVDLDSARRQLVETVSGYASFIDERILWERNTEPVGTHTPGLVVEALAELSRSARDLSPVEALGAAWVRRPVPLLLEALGLLLLGFGRPWLRRRIRANGKRVREVRISPFSDTVESLLLTIGVALFAPLLLRALGDVFGASPEGLPAALGRALPRAAVLLTPFALIHAMCLPLGLGEVHLRWTEAAVKALRRAAPLAGVVIVGALVVALVVDEVGGETAIHSLGRLALTIALAALTAFSWWLFREASVVRRQLASSAPAGWRVRLAPLWVLLAVGFPILLLVGLLLGYQDTASRLGQRLLGSWSVVLVVVLAHALALRWLAMEKRVARLDLARRRREAAGADGGELPEDVDTHLDLEAVDSQARALLRAAVVFVVALALWGLWAEILPAFGALRRVTLWEANVERVTELEGGATALSYSLVPVTLADFLLGAAVFLMTLSAARNTPGFLDVAVFRRFGLEASTRYALATFARYAISIVGILLAFGSVGVGWGQVQWLVAAMGLGLGFGLQEIFGNFVCGIILLFERRIRVDDVVTVGDISGKVMRIRVLATSIRDWDRKEYVVPNKELITGRLLNWTLSDQVNRVIVDVGVAYGSDTQLACQLLEQVARANPLTLDDPPPMATFEGFGDSALLLRLRAFLPDLENRLQVLSALHRDVAARFAEVGLEIAFPQRDLHVRSLPAGTLAPPGAAEAEES